ncbi:cytochrome P450 [Spinellus fusiger]|nr:cytochrome P450 [Spinellus fusiger]
MTSILTIAYGDICSFEPGDPKLHEAYALTEQSAAIFGPIEQLAEFFSVIKYIMPNRDQKYKDLGHAIEVFYGGLLTNFKKLKEEPENVKDCFVKEILGAGILTDLQIMNFISLFIGAGSETTTSTLRWMFAILANNPDIQERAYQEIVTNVGTDVLPSYEDGKKS